MQIWDLPPVTGPREYSIKFDICKDFIIIEIKKIIILLYTNNNNNNNINLGFVLHFSNFYIKLLTNDN